MDGPIDGAGRVWAEFLSALDTLPPATRAAFLLHALFDASHEDIERITGLRRDACARHLEAARAAMRHRARAFIDPQPHSNGDTQ